jgi:hypothetical protein
MAISLGQAGFENLISPEKATTRVLKINGDRNFCRE